MATWSPELLKAPTYAQGGIVASGGWTIPTITASRGGITYVPLKDGLSTSDNRIINYLKGTFDD